MKLVYTSAESASVEDGVSHFMEKLKTAKGGAGWYIVSAQLNITFGAFMHISALLLVDESKTGGDLAVVYSTGGGREAAVLGVVEKLNTVIKNAEVVSFRIGSYTTPVTRRTYAVGIVAYNRPALQASEVSKTSDRRELLAHVLSLFDYNPRVLNVSELARIFDVSRDTIYYDIQQILEEKKRD
ncbi:HTH domain-containing protein [Thermococcus waiotapuensis]|uniref:HTH domain-containing protein n=1 Tax=Thermococcus waiotapuensis TaxID=90909 RepID=A0AAE4NWB6_9EURY|nr:HTH domain-containing protein [Thermococcus waiotapuensis]MDV3104770.1 HTH domain-containing protein [Thermococcus waiotapuensis]